MAQQTQEIISLLTTLAGGAAAGYVDVKYATKTVAGLPLGAVGGLGLAAIGLFGGKLKLSAKITDACLDGAAGMLAFEAGTMVAQKTLKSMLPAPAPTAAGVAGMRGGSVGQMGVGQHDFMSQLSQIEAAYSRAA